MILIILTQAGIDQADEALRSADQVWLNPELLTPQVHQQFANLNIQLHALPEYFDANKDKAITAALDYVERHSDDDDILIECP